MQVWRCQAHLPPLSHPLLPPDMRLHMQAVMRYAGPRMLLHHPMSALQHLWNELNSPVHQTATTRKPQPGEPAQEKAVINFVN